MLLQLLAELLELLLGEAGAYLGDGLELLGILVVDRQQEGAIHPRALAPVVNMGSQFEIVVHFCPSAITWSVIQLPCCWASCWQLHRARRQIMLRHYSRTCEILGQALCLPERAPYSH